MNSLTRRISPWYRLLGIVLLALALQTCASSRKTPAKMLERRGADYLLEEMVARQFQPEWMSARARIKYEDGYMSVGGTANILLRKDSLFWVSVRKLGFEVARAMITTDSVYVIDRLNNEYLVEDLSYLAREYQVPADFTALQAIILGNPLLFARSGFSVVQEAPLYHIRGANGTMESHYWLEGTNLQLRRMAFDDRLAERNLRIELNDYQPAGKKSSFSHARTLQMSSEDTGSLAVQIDFGQVEFNIPKSVRFDIPDRYTRTD